MSSISKIRLANILYDNGKKVIQDNIFDLAGEDAAMLLENGGGKTLMIQLICQSVIPNIEVASRKLKESVKLDNNTIHIGMEWIVSDHPKTYCLTSVSFYKNDEKVESVKYVCEYEEKAAFSIEDMAYSKQVQGGTRAATYHELTEFLQEKGPVNGRFFKTGKEYGQYIKSKYGIDPEEWRKIASINSGEGEGGLAKFFASCTNSQAVVDRFLIPTIEEKNAANDFSKTFEKHIENFKNYNELVKTIEEVKNVQQKLKEYRADYERYHGEELEQSMIKGQLKSILRQNIQDENENQKQLEALKVKLQENDQKKKDLSQEEQICLLCSLQDEVEIAERNYQKQKAALDKISEEWDALHEEIQQRNLAKEKFYLDQDRADLKAQEESLSSMEKDQSVQQIIESLLENSGQLRYWYQQEIQTIRSLLNQKEIGIEDHKKQIQSLNTLLSNSREELIELKSNLSSCKTAYELHTKNIQNIKTKLGMSEDQTFHLLVKEKNQKTRDNEKKGFVLTEESKKIQEQMEALQKTKLSQEKMLYQVSAQRQSLNDKLEDYKDKKNDFTAKLLAEKASGAIYYDVYEQRIKIEEDLSYSYKKAQDEERSAKEDYIRKSLEFTKYADMEYFVADRFLSDYLAKNSAIGKLEKGTQFAFRMLEETQMTSEEMIAIYPYWASTIISYEEDIRSVKEQILQAADKITLPIHVLYYKEIQDSIRKKEAFASTPIIPLSWEAYLYPEQFRQWKAVAKEELLAAEELEGSKRQVTAQRRNLLEAAKEFFRSYPYEGYKSTEDDIKSLDIRLDKLMNDLEEIKRQMQFSEEASHKIQTEIQFLTDENHQIALDIMDANQGIDYQQEAEKAKQDEITFQRAIRIHEDKILQIETEQEEKREGLEKLKNAHSRDQQSLSLIMAENGYRETEEAQPIENELDGFFLKKQREELKKRELGISSERAQIMAQIKRIKDSIAQAEKRIDHLKQENPNLIIHPGFFYHEGLSKEIEEAIKRKKIVERQKKIVQEESNSSQMQLEREKGKLEVKKEEYYVEYQQAFSYQKEWQSLREENGKKILENKKEKEYLEKTSQKLNKNQNVLQKANQELEIIDAQYQCFSSSITAVELSNDALLDMQYDRMRLISAQKEMLQSLSLKIQSILGVIATEKENIFSFLRDQVADLQLRRATQSGLKNYNQYNDLVEWLDTNDQNLSHIINVKEQGKHDSQKDFYNLVANIYKHMRLIINEFYKIMNNTRIKMQGEWKNIFDIKVPDIDEDIAMKEIEDIMMELIEDLKNVQETDIKKRKIIQDRLSTKAILHKLTKGNIRIRTRKVQNDCGLSEGFFSYEVSNKWSGGERWSKNMALFLGILKYINSDTNRKDKRAVVLDNPFGEASSDHVLAPVFLVTHQLGYQIIAFTAHTGSFIVDHFKVVQSLKFRKARNADQQILQNEISSAYMNADK